MLGGAILVFEEHHFLSCSNNSCVYITRALDVQDSGSKSRDPALARAIGYRYSKLAPLPSVCRPRFLHLYLNVIMAARKDIHEKGDGRVQPSQVCSRSINKKRPKQDTYKK